MTHDICSRTNAWNIDWKWNEDSKRFLDGGIDIVQISGTRIIDLLRACEGGSDFIL